MQKRVRTLVFALVFMLPLLVPQPTSAIQYGVVDDGRHSYVGGLVYEWTSPDGGTVQYVGCSGTMIGATTFLTASHCYPDAEYRLVGVTFADAYEPGDPVVPLTNDSFVINPNYSGAYSDVAVVLLPYDPDVGVAAIPELAYLETLAPSASRGKPVRTLTAVGYGTTGLNRGQGGPPAFVYPDVRMRSENHIIGIGSAVHAGYLVQTTAAPGTGGGTCYGDSGGPFLEKSSGTVYVVAITITGFNQNCGGADLNLRTDIESVQSFLAPYIS